MSHGMSITLLISRQTFSLREAVTSLSVRSRSTRSDGSLDLAFDKGFHRADRLPPSSGEAPERKYRCDLVMLDSLPNP